MPGMPTGSGVVSGARGAGPNPASVRTPKAPPQRTTKPNPKGKGTSGPTGAEVRDKLRAAGPGKSDRSGSRGGSTSGGAPSSRQGGPTASIENSLPSVASGPKTGALITEFLLAVVLIFIGVFTSNKTYTQRMSSAL